MMRPLLALASILILSLTFSCNDDDLPMEETSLVTNEPISMCDNYDFYNPEGIGFIDFAAEFNGDFIYGGQSGFQIWDNFDSDLLHESIQNNFFIVNGVQPFDTYALICTTAGLYEYDDQKNLTKLSDDSCNDIVLYQDKVLFSSNGRISEWDAEQQTVKTFRGFNEENYFNSFQDLQVVGDKLFAITSTNLEVRISEYEGAELIKDYTAFNDVGLETISFPGNPLNSFLVSDGTDLIYWTSNGLSKYLYRKVGDRFEELINTENFMYPFEPSLMEEFIRFVKSHQRDIRFRDNKLLMGSVKGLFEIDLTSNPVGFQLNVDNQLPNNNISYYDLSTDFGGASYVVTNLNTVVRISCN